MQNILNTKQFSGKIIRTELIIPYTKEDHAYFIFLSELLNLSSKKYPITRELIKIREELYDATIKLKVLLRGQDIILQINLLYLNILNLEEEKKCIELLKEIITNPNINNHEWNYEDFNYAKNIIDHEYQMYEDDPKGCAYQEALAFFTPNTGLGGFGTGIYEELKKITAKKIAVYYEDFMKKAQMQYFGMGNFSDALQKHLKSIFKIEFDKRELCENKLITNPKIAKKTKKLNNQQTIVHLSFKIQNMSKYEAEYVLPIFDDLFGGSVGTGKLFNKIREEKGYAYYAYSKNISFTNLIMVVVGTKNKFVDDVVLLANQALKEIQNGEINDEFIPQLLNVYLQKLDTVYDQPKLLFNQFIKEYNGMVDSIAQKKEFYQTITKDKIIKLAKKINMDAIYILEGED